MLVDLKVLNNSGYRGIAEKISNKYKPVLIENAGVSIFLRSIRVNYPCNFLKKYKNNINTRSFFHKTLQIVHQ